MLDPDEAVTGLMAARIADGQHYAYFAGQRYMGALEQYLQAPFAAAAPGNAFLLRVPQLAIAAWAGWLVYRVGSEMLGERRAAVAAWLFAAGPAFSVIYGVKSRGAYGSALVAGLLGWLIALRHRPGRRELRTGAAFGLCCGLAGWLSPLAAVLLLPAAGWLAGSGWRRRSRAAAGAGTGGVLGALPLLADWARHGITTGLGTPPPSTPGERLRGLAHPVLPEFLGFAWRVGEPVLPSVVGVAAGLAVVGGVLGGSWRQRRGLAALLALGSGRYRSGRYRSGRWRSGQCRSGPCRSGRDPERRRPADLLLVAAAVGLVGYVASAYSWYTAEPRYLFPLYPVLALGLAAVLPAAGRWAARAACVAVAGTAALCVGTLTSSAGTDQRADLVRAAAFLHSEGERWVYTDYQVGYPLDYYAGSRVVAVPYGSNGSRFPDLAAAVAAAPSPAYAVLDVDAPRVATALDQRGVQYRRSRFGHLVTFTALRPAATPAQLGLTH